MTNLLLIFEEIFPFVIFARNKWKKIHQIQTKGAPEQKVKEYSTLPLEKLKQRLTEEHDRATKIDEKTTKFTLGLSVSLTILSTTSGTLAKLLPDNNINSTIIILCGIASVFMLIAGIISLGALKTLPRYGYGTMHEICAEKKEIGHFASVLFLQEEINIVRHQRNEAAYQCLRNGFLLLLLALVISIFFIKIPADTKHSINSSSDLIVTEKNIVKKETVLKNATEKVKLEPAKENEDAKETSDNKSIQATGKSAGALTR
ncbi:MAG: hypothetical protein KKF37_00325 [Proteobacteria bacterium]|nr:hypothetical protein [Pseudomonadota bacterium]